MTVLFVLLLVFVIFLGTLGALSVAVAKGANASGSKTGGCLGGCGLVLAFAFLCGMGFLGLGAFLVTLLVGTAVEVNPIRKIEIRRGEPRVAAEAAANGAGAGWEEGDPSAPVHLLFTVEGSIGSELADLVGRVGGVDPSEMQDFLTIYRRTNADGSELWIYDFCLPLTERRLAEIEEDIRRELDGLQVHLPASVTIHFEGAERLY